VTTECAGRKEINAHACEAETNVRANKSEAIGKLVRVLRLPGEERLTRQVPAILMSAAQVGAIDHGLQGIFHLSLRVGASRTRIPERAVENEIYGNII